MSGGEVLQAVVAEVLGAPVSAEALVEALDTRRMTHVARLLHLRLARCRDRAAAEAGLARLDALSEAEARRLLRSPRLCEILRGDGPDEALWTALAGDSGGTAERRLACGLRLDRSLPAALVHPSAGLRCPRPLTEAEEEAAARRLDAAIEVLGAVHPLGRRVLVELTSDVVLRADDERPGECWGASSGFAIGRTVVVHAEAAASAALLGEVLLHEATHCALDCAELEGSLAVIGPGALEVTVRSPWTGAPLFTHAFIHATVVWAVLLDYWARYAARFGEDDEARARIGFIRRGFTSCDLPSTLGPISAYLGGAAPAVIAEAWAAAQAVPG